jgi:hypothetical protein
MAAPKVAYGDTVLLHDFGEGGYVTCRKRKGCCVMLEVLTEGYEQPPKVADCLFQIIPKLAFSAYNRYHKAVRAAQGAPPETHKKNELAMEAKLKLKEEEQKANQEFITKMQGTPITYGTVIMLKAVAAESYVTLLKERAEVDGSCLKLALTDDGGKEAWFEFNPGFKTGKLGEQVSYPSAVSLLNVKSEVYMHMSVEIDSKIPSPHPNVTRVCEANGGANASVLKILFYGQDQAKEMNSLAIKAGQVLTMYHADSEAYLVYTADRHGEMRVFFKTIEGSALDSSSLWTIEAHHHRHNPRCLRSLSLTCHFLFSLPG